MGFSTPETVVTSGTGHSLSGPDWGEIGEPSLSFTVQRDNTGPTLARFTPARAGTTFTPAYVDVPKNSLATFSADPADYGDGTLTLANDGGLGTISRNFHAKIPVGTTILGSAGNQLNWGGWIPNSTGHLSILNEDITALPVDALSPSIMAKHVELFGVGRKVNWDLLSQGYGRGVSVVDGDTPLKTAILGIYASEADPAPLPIIDNPGVGGNATPPVYGEPASADSHAIVFDRDSKLCYVLYKASKDYGTGQWYGSHESVWDFANGGGGYGLGTPKPLRPSTGSLRWLGDTSETVHGLPILATTLRYDEAVRGPVTHAMRLTIANNWMAQTFTYPARHRSFAGPSSSNVLPGGARLRMKADRYAYYLSLFGPTGEGNDHVVANIVWGLRHRGFVNTDGTVNQVHPQPDVMLDERWDDVPQAQSKLEMISMDDFEVVEMVRGISLQADKTWCRPGETVRLTARYEPFYLYGDDNFGFSSYFSLTDGATFRTANVVASAPNFVPASPTITYDWTPQLSDVGGPYSLSVRDIKGNLKDAPIAFTVLAPDAPDPDPQPAPGDEAMTWPLGHFLRRKAQAVTPTAPDTPTALAWRPFGFLLRKASTVATPEEAPPALAWRPLAPFLRRAAEVPVDPETLPPDLTSAVRRLVAATPSLSALSEFSIGRASPDAGPTYSVVHHSGSSPLFKSSSSEWTTERLTFRLFASNADAVNAVGLAFEAAAKSWRAIDYRYGYALPLTEPQRRLDEVRARRPGDKGSFVYELTYSAKCRRGRD
jgi:hypothetical protein